MEKKDLLFLTSALLALFAGPGLAQLPAAAESHTPRPELALEYLEDPSGALTIGEIAAPAQSGRFRPANAERFNFGFSSSAYWFRFPTPARPPNLLLEVDCPLLDAVTFYQPLATGGFRAREGGQLIPFRERPVAYRNPVFPLLAAQAELAPNYLRCQSQGTIFFALKLWTPADFAAKSRQELYLLAFYYLTLAGLALYNGVVFTLTRDKSHAYYLAFIASFTLWQLDYNGLSEQFLWPDHPWLSTLATPLSINLTGVSALLFTREFLQSKIHTPRLDRLFHYLLLCLGGAMLLCLQPHYRTSIVSAALLVTLYTPLLLVAGAIRWRQGYRPAGYYTVAWSTFLLGSFLLAWKCLGLLPSNFASEYGQQIGAIIEMYLLSLALIDQYSQTKKEKEALQAAALALQESAQQRLGAEIAAKTRELQASTLQATRLAAKLAKYLSPQLYESIFAGRTEVALKSERKMLTVFFSDIKNFTRLTDTIEAEELSAFLNDYLERMARIALDHGGTIDKFIGDGIMIFFGDPESRGVREDALACLRMALAMRRTATEFNQGEFAYLLAEPLHIRMGINSGFCTVGNFGAENRLDYTIIGGQVNLAARLEKAADDDEILISAKTHELIKDEVHCRKKARLAVKGIAHPVLTYSVLGASPPAGEAGYRGPERRGGAAGGGSA